MGERGRMRGMVTQGRGESFGGGGYAHYADCRDTLTSIYTYANLLNTYFKYVQLIACQLYLNKAV